MHYHSLPYHYEVLGNAPKGLILIVFRPPCPPIFVACLPANLCGGSAESNKKTQPLRTLRLERSPDGGISAMLRRAVNYSLRLHALVAELLRKSLSSNKSK